MSRAPWTGGAGTSAGRSDTSTGIPLQLCPLHALGGGVLTGSNRAESGGYFTSYPGRDSSLVLRLSIRLQTERAAVTGGPHHTPAIHTYKHTCTHVHVHAYTHTHTHTCTQDTHVHKTHMHTCTQDTHCTHVHEHVLEAHQSKKSCRWLCLRT